MWKPRNLFVCVNKDVRSFFKITKGELKIRFIYECRCVELFILNREIKKARERERSERTWKEEGNCGGRARCAVQRRGGLDLPCSGVSVVLLWCMFTALLALPYWSFYTFGKI